MAISRPMLPPKKGYVEVEVNGVRTYQNVETGILIEDEVMAPSAQDDIDAMMVDHEYRLTMLELGLTE